MSTTKSIPHITEDLVNTDFAKKLSYFKGDRKALGRYLEKMIEKNDRKI